MLSGVAKQGGLLAKGRGYSLEIGLIGAAEQPEGPEVDLPKPTRARRTGFDQKVWGDEQRVTRKVGGRQSRFRDRTTH